MTTARPEPPGDPEVSIGGYRLLSRIGEGGMGVVHVAQAPDGTRVALKVIRPHVVGDEEGRQRLAREVSSLQRVRSEHVAEVLDADPWGAAPYVVTRYVPGHSLDETVRRDGPLTAEDLEYAARRLLHAVQDVHAAGVLHRDIKPTNVVMEGRAPILIDFGLARLADDPRLTATGFLLGTPGYLAPEVLLGDEATPATDLHGWAATLTYAATGRPPYGRGHTMAILDRTRRGEADLRDVPHHLRPLLAACLAPEPLDRPTIREALAELDELAESALPTQAVALDGPSRQPGPTPDHTMPWQLVPAEPPRDRAAEADTEVRSPAGPAAVPPTRQYTAVARPAPTTSAPVPPPGVPAPAPTRQPVQQPVQQPVRQPLQQPLEQPWPPAWPRPLSGWARFRRALMLLGLLVLVAVSFRAAPYLSFAVLAAVVVAARGISRSQQASWRRRAVRGSKWFDGPLAVVAYPWHTLRGALGALVLLLLAGGVGALAVAGLVLLGFSGPDALLAGGAVTALVSWCGPGSRRVREPVVRLLGVVARPALPGWLTVAGLAVAALGVWLAFHGEVVWSPASGSPWQELRSAVPDRLTLP